MSDLPALLNTLSEGVNPTLIKACTDVSHARSMVMSGDHSDSLDEIHTNLVNNRHQIERIEEITATLLLLRSRTAQALAAKKAVYEDAYASSMTKRRPSFAEFTSAKEKDANAAAETVAEALEMRKAEKVHRDVESAHEFCRVLLRGAEGTHRDLELRIRIISLSSSLDK